MVVCNCAPALLFRRGEALEALYSFEFSDGVITNVYAIRNPDKLAAAATARAISRG
jgi:RNA polymerase sigma-70 factor (ECF subfamily)